MILNISNKMAYKGVIYIQRNYINVNCVKKKWKYYSENVFYIHSKKYLFVWKKGML